MAELNLVGIAWCGWVKNKKMCLRSPIYRSAYGVVLKIDSAYFPGSANTENRLAGIAECRHQ